MTQRRSRPLTPTIGRRLFFIWAALWAVISTIFSTIGSVTHNVLSKDIRAFRLWSRIWGRSMTLGMAIRVKTTQRVPLDESGAYVFAINHQVALDIPAVGIGIPCPFGWVAKAELANVPFLGSSIKNSPSVFIDRSHPKKSIESMRVAGERIRKGLSVAIFPEGSRSHSAELQEFKRGAFMLAIEAGVPVVPVTILNALDLFNEKTKLARPGTMHIIIGEPIHIEGWTRSDIPRLMDEVRAVMQRELDEWNRPDVLP
jgi:1-acyl-sn-glycerol-3-phosphate acyltransferase